LPVLAAAHLGLEFKSQALGRDCFTTGVPLPGGMGKPVNRVCPVSVVALRPFVVACTAATATKSASDAASASGATRQLTVKVMDTLKFDPTTLTINAGQAIQGQSRSDRGVLL
jgi:hypothetical protein